MTTFSFLIVRSTASQQCSPGSPAGHGPAFASIDHPFVPNGRAMRKPVAHGLPDSFGKDTHKQTCQHHRLTLFHACTNLEVPSDASFPSSLSIFPAVNAASPRGASFSFLHHLEENPSRVEVHFSVGHVQGRTCKLPAVLDCIPLA